MTKRDSYLKNLPEVGENSEIQTNSFDALNSFLPKDRFCLRDERIEDYGVDASLEILENGHATNFRSQIQLKGTRSIEPNKDGSYSLQVDTSNLNYLLNSPISIYILYIEAEKEFRFVWARNEFQRLEKENPDWIKQKTITLRFNEVLDSAKLDEIREQIIKQSSFHRELNETLILAQPSNVLLEINPNTFEITDKKVILNLISSFGINLVNEGYRREILDKINLLDAEDREKSFVQTVRAYAEYYSGHYHTAKEVITFLTVSGQEISNKDQQTIDWLEAACDYRLGNIDSKEYTKRLREIAEKDDAEKFSSFRFDYIHRLLLTEGSLEQRKELVNQLRGEVKKLPQDELMNENILLFSYYVLEAELGTIIQELSEDMSNISIRKSLNVYRDINDLAKDVAKLIVAHRERATKWKGELNEIFERTENQTLKADIIVENVLYVISKFSIIQFHSRANGVAFEEIEDDVFEQCKRYLYEAIEIYSNLNLYERKLRAESHLAELMRLKGRNEEADEMLSSVSNKSSKLNYAHIKKNAENPLSKIFDKVFEEANSADLDEKWANSSDEEIEAFAQDILRNLGLPEDRFANIKKDVLANREINKEKLYWCEHIELHQNLRHTQNPETHFAIDPDRFGHCTLHNYNSVFGDPEYASVILAFKKTYCENCPDRKPKKN